jgi:hypothetical protein
MPAAQHLGLLKTFVDESELFLVVFVELGNPFEVSFLVIKGERTLRESSESEYPKQLKLGELAS